MEEKREAFNHITSWAASSFICALLPLLQDSVTTVTRMIFFALVNKSFGYISQL
jgi:hypothetical protein